MTRPKDDRNVANARSYWPHRMLVVGALLMAWPNLKASRLAVLTGFSEHYVRKVRREWNRMPPRWQEDFFRGVEGLCRMTPGTQERKTSAFHYARKHMWLFWMLADTTDWARHDFYTKVLNYNRFNTERHEI